MRVKFYIALGTLLTTLSFSCRASLPATTPSAASANASKLTNIGNSQIQKTDSNTSLTSTAPQEQDNQNLGKNKYSRIDPNDPQAARKEKLLNDSIIGLMGVESSSTLDKINWNISGPNTHLGRARGFSQVMDDNLTARNPNEWAMKYLGGPVDPNYYNSSPELQVKLTTGVIGGYANELVNKYPNYSDQQLRAMIYSKWFTGSYGNAGNYGVNDGYTNAPQYIYKAENFLAKAYQKYGNNLPAISGYVN